MKKNITGHKPDADVTPPPSPPPPPINFRPYFFYLNLPKYATRKLKAMSVSYALSAEFSDTSDKCSDIRTLL